jgi:ABC-type uncharacterized transport system substrate-binding protein
LVACRSCAAARQGLANRISSPSSSGQNDNLKSFVQTLNDLGYIDGKNIHFERRVADGNLDRLSALAAELIQTNVDVILAESSFAVEAAQRRIAGIGKYSQSVGQAFRIAR